MGTCVRGLLRAWKPETCPTIEAISIPALSGGSHSAIKKMVKTWNLNDEINLEGKKLEQLFLISNHFLCSVRLLLLSI